MSAPAQTKFDLVVVGAHLSGMALNHDLVDRGAVLERTCSTAPTYKLYALPDTTPPKPGLLRVGEAEGHPIAVEVWSLDAAAFGSFIAAIPAPLGVGSVFLEDGTCATGFLVEAIAVKGARDISEFGGWRAYMAQSAVA